MRHDKKRGPYRVEIVMLDGRIVIGETTGKLSQAMKRHIQESSTARLQQDRLVRIVRDKDGAIMAEYDGRPKVVKELQRLLK